MVIKDQTKESKESVDGGVEERWKRDGREEER